VVHLCVLVDTYKTTNLIDLKVSDFTFKINLLPFLHFCTCYCRIIDAVNVHILLVALFHLPYET